jgi:hypothetical protein
VKEFDLLVQEDLPAHVGDGEAATVDPQFFQFVK